MTRTTVSVRPSYLRQASITALGFSRQLAYDLPDKGFPGLAEAENTGTAHQTNILCVRDQTRSEEAPIFQGEVLVDRPLSGGQCPYSDDNPETGKPYYSQLYMSNYATIQFRDALARVDGVADVTIFGQQDYSMRVWLDPDKMTSRNLTAGDVIRVVREQNVHVAAGQIGRPPVPYGQDFQYSLSTVGRLVEAEQFANIILKTGTIARSRTSRTSAGPNWGPARKCGARWARRYSPA